MRRAWIAALIAAVLVSGLGAAPGAPAQAGGEQQFAYAVRGCQAPCTDWWLDIVSVAAGVVVAEIPLALSEVQGYPAEPLSGSGDLTVSPDGRRVYISFDQRIVEVREPDHVVLRYLYTATASLASPRSPVVSPDGRSLFVLDVDANGASFVAEVSLSTRASLRRLPVTGVTNASRLVLVSGGQRAIVMSSQTLAAVTLATGETVTRAHPLSKDLAASADGGSVVVIRTNLDPGDPRRNWGFIDRLSVTTLETMQSREIIGELGTPRSVAVGGDGARVFVGETGSGYEQFHAVDAATFADAGRTYGPSRLVASPDGRSLLAAGVRYQLAPAPGGFQSVWMGYSVRNLTTLVDTVVRPMTTAQIALLAGMGIGPRLGCDGTLAASSNAVSHTGGTVTVTAAFPTGCGWSVGVPTGVEADVVGGVGTATVTLTVAPNMSAGRSLTVTVGSQSLTLDQAANPNILIATPMRLNFSAQVIAGSGAQVLGFVTDPQTLHVSYAGQVVPDWTVTVDKSWLSVSPTSGRGAGQLIVSVLSPSVPGPSDRVATITITSQTASLQVPVHLTIRVSNVPAVVGQVDTPVQHAAGVQGAVALTGWALDAYQVTGVRVFRGCLPFDAPSVCQNINGHLVVSLGDATFVPGARPDVEAAFPSYPQTHRAGWGINILTPMLPNVPAQQPQGGVGDITLYAFAVTGNNPNTLTLLGRSTGDQEPTRITLANDTIAKPFGAIDTPAQGAIVNGTVNNFGWVLTPDPGTGVLVPLNGSTITVFVDGAAVGTAAYNLCRGGVAVGGMAPPGTLCDDDVSAAFRGGGTTFRNLDAGRGAIGLRAIDSTTLTNGLHTLSWSVTDSANRSEGIGSRYINVINGATDSWGAAGVERRDAGAPIVARTGFDLQAAYAPLALNTDGVPYVRIPELGRVELRVPGLTGASLIVGGEMRRAPVGLAVNQATGTVTWTPGPGFLGTYRLSFGARTVDVTVVPASDAVEPVRMHVDRVDQSGALVVVHGWSLDPSAASGAGIGAVHVWAKLVEDGATPLFLGSAETNVARHDVASAHGERFANAGFAFTGVLPGVGTWEITAYVWNIRTGRFEDARSVTVTVR